MKRIPTMGLLFIILAAGVVAADTLDMHNGDCISGAIISISDGIVRIDTTYAGEIAIQMEAVKAIETDAPRAVALPGNLTVEGHLTAEEDGAGVRVGKALHPVAPAEITALAADMEALHRLLYPPPPSKWSGAVDAGLALRSGNTDTTDAKLAAEIKRAGNRNTLTLNFAAAYGSADDTLNTRRFQGDFRWQYYLKERLYVYTMGLAERDDGRKLDYRLQGGGGVGYDFIKNDRRALSADAGLTYTYEQWNSFTPWERTQTRNAIRDAAYDRFYAVLMSIGDGNNRTVREVVEQLRDILADIRDPLRDYRKRKDDYVNLRLGLNYSQQVFRSSTLSEALVFMPSLDDIGEFRALSELALTTPLTEALDLRASLKTEYDSLADERGVEAWDNTLMTQFRYKF